MGSLPTCPCAAAQGQPNGLQVLHPFLETLLLACDEEPQGVFIMEEEAQHRVQKNQSTSEGLHQPWRTGHKECSVGVLTQMEHLALASELKNHTRSIPHDVAVKTVASKKRRDNCRSIPHDVLIEILSRVPGRSLVRFRCVCKLWSSFFHDRHFISLQLNQAAKNPSTFIGYPSFREQFVFYSLEIEAGKGVHGNEFIVTGDRRDTWRMSNACKGLIAFYGKYCAYVANPCTREWMALPKVTPHGEGSDGNSLLLVPFIGLGFCTATRRHKLIRIFSRDGRKWACEVLTLGTDSSWRSLGPLPYYISKFLPAYMNGYIYWTIDYAGPECILSFDVCREEFTTLRSPKCHPEPDRAAYHHFSMSVLEGSLCAVDWRLYADDTGIYYLPEMHIHVLKKDEVDYMWTESRKIRFKRVRIYPKDKDQYQGAAFLSLFPISIQNGKLLLHRRFKFWKIYDLQTGTCSKIKLPFPDDVYDSHVQDIWTRGYPFVCEESIVPIKMMVEDS